MIKSITDCTILNNGNKMPWLGFGSFKIEDGKNVEQAVTDALECGYRSIDTASIYGNESGVGKAIRESGIPRGDIFLTTKLWNDDQRSSRQMEAFEESLERLGVDYVDLYLVHWPVKEYYMKSWETMERIYESGRSKAIGVSNFMIDHLEDILGTGGTVPAVNQVEFHPMLVQPELLDFCKQNKIQLEAWSPLMQSRILDNPIIKTVAENYGKSPAQIVLRWDLQHEVVTIPKSSHKQRILVNSRIFDFKISTEDMAVIDALDAGKRVGSDPYNFSF